MSETTRLDSELRRELIAGERLLWSGRPDPKRMRSVFWIWAFAIPWTMFALGWTGIAAAAFIAGLVKADPDFSWFFLFFPLFGLPFIGVGIWMLSKPFTILKDARHTIHALTDQRVLTLTHRKERTLRSVEIDKFGPITRTEKADGWGHLSIETGSHKDSDGDKVTDKFEMVGIPEVAKLERLLREAQEAR